MDEHERFLLTFPCYSLMQRKNPTQLAYLGDLRKGKIFTVIFSDRDLCDTFLERSGNRERIIPIQLKGPRQLAAYLEAAGDGIEQILFDPAFPVQRVHTMMTLTDLREELRSRFK